MTYDIFFMSLASYFLYMGYINNISCRYRNSVYNEHYNCQCDSKCGENKDCCSDSTIQGVQP